MANLISNQQINQNLKRSAFKGLISALDSEQLEQLALKYFGVRNEQGDIVNYMCPYSGKILVDAKDIVLEHIIPISSKGGTVLFNCIPTSSEVNKQGEKGAQHLISWWTNSKYWDKNAPQRLENLVNYMLEAYEVVFENHSIQEIEDSCLKIIEQTENDKEDDLSIDERKERNKLREQAKNNGIISYLGFMLSCVETLEKYGISTEKIRQKLQELEDKNVFKDINRFEQVQKIVQKTIKQTLTEDKQAYLTYSLKININKLIDSINSNSEGEISNEIVKRINYIQELLENETTSLVDYYKNLHDIEDVNLLYFDIESINDQRKNDFLENLKLGFDSRIMIFIEMIKKAKTKEELAEIFKGRTTKPFTIYKKDATGNYIEDKTYGEIRHFWSSNKDQIQPILEKMMEEDVVLRDKLDDYYMNTLSGQTSAEGRQRRINIFIEMIKNARTKEELVDIFKQKTTKSFTIYKQDITGNYIEDKTYGKIGDFYQGHKDKIQPILEKMMEEDVLLRDKLDDYYMNTLSGQQSVEGRQRRINIFIEMIKRARTAGEISEIFKNRTSKPFMTYRKDASGNYIEDKTYEEINCFWQSNKDQIEPILEKMMEEDVVLRDKLDDYYMNTRSGQQSAEGNQRRINIFIEMIKRARTVGEISEIFKDGTKKPFTTYKKDATGNYIEDKTYGEIRHFWRSNKDQIQPILEKMMEEDVVLRDKLDDYYMNTLSGQTSAEGRQRRINIFIEMIKKAKTKEELVDIFKQKTTKSFTTYKKDVTGNYIEDKIYGKIGCFYQDNKDKIQLILEKMMEEDVVLRDTLDDYYMNYKGAQRSYEGNKRRINIFIEMIKRSTNKEELANIFKARTSKPFTTYKKDSKGNYIEDKTYGEIGQFWIHNNDKNIIPQLFFDEKYTISEYDIVRQRVMDYLNSLRRKRKLPEFRTINEYIDTLDKTKKEVRELIELRDSLLSRKEQLSIENESLKAELNASYGRAI